MIGRCRCRCCRSVVVVVDGVAAPCCGTPDLVREPLEVETVVKERFDNGRMGRAVETVAQVQLQQERRSSPLPIK